MRAWARHGLLAAASVGFLAAGLVAADVASHWERPLGDLLLRLDRAAPPSLPAGMPDVVVVAIDEASLAVGRAAWPWPRSLFAQLVARLDTAGARLIALDVDLTHTRELPGQASLGDALARSGRVLLAEHRPAHGGAAPPPSDLVARAAGVAAAIVEPDPDGIVRHSAELLVREQRALRLLPAAMLALATSRELSSEPLHYRLDERRLEPPPLQLSAVDVLEGRFDPRDLAGQVVLIGVTAAGRADTWATPLAPHRPGVLVQALAYRTLAARTSGAAVLVTPDRTAQIAGLLLLSCCAGALHLLQPRSRRRALLALAFGVVVAVCFALREFALLLDPALPFAILAAHALLGMERFERLLLPSGERRLAPALLRPALPDASGLRPLDPVLELLADLVDASGVALLSITPDGELANERLQWVRRGSRSVGDVDTANLVLADRAPRVFEGRVPGRREPGGLAVYTPLFAGPTAVGVLVVEQDVASHFDETQLRSIATVGTQLALSVESFRLLGNLRSTFHSSIELLATAVEARDGYTEMHCRRLAAFATLMADRLGLPADEIESIRLGALLHDVGKIGIRDEILMKESRLTPDERRHIEEHPLIGHRIVEPIEGLTPTSLGIVRHHHERWNGTGYPDGLAGEEIPLGARIVALADVWDALSTPRPYKPAFPQAQVRALIEKESGGRFEPALVALFLEILEEHGDEMLALCVSSSAPTA